MNLAPARRAVAIPDWRWVPGMGCVNPALPDAWCARIGDECRPTYDHYLPDLDDPATLGCLLALVREALGDPAAHCEQLFTGDWAVFDQTGGLVAKGATEAEALVAALEAAGGGE